MRARVVDSQSNGSPHPPRKNAFPVFVSVGMSRSNGVRPSLARISQKNVSISNFSLDLTKRLVKIGNMRNKPAKPTKNPAAQALGRLGGLVRGKQLAREKLSEMGKRGGRARAAKLTAAQRRRIAKMGVRAREAKRRSES